MYSTSPITPLSICICRKSGDSFIDSEDKLIKSYIQIIKDLRIKYIVQETTDTVETFLIYSMNIQESNKNHIQMIQILRTTIIFKRCLN